MTTEQFTHNDKEKMRGMQKGTCIQEISGLPNNLASL